MNNCIQDKFNARKILNQVGTKTQLVQEFSSIRQFFPVEGRNNLINKIRIQLVYYIIYNYIFYIKKTLNYCLVYLKQIYFNVNC